LMDSKGVTVGMTLPVANINNAITLGLDFGRRGKLSGGLIRENYMSISIGVNVYDIWFLKHQYQ